MEKVDIGTVGLRNLLYRYTVQIILILSVYRVLNGCKATEP